MAATFFFFLSSTQHRRKRKADALVVEQVVIDLTRLVMILPCWERVDKRTIG